MAALVGAFLVILVLLLFASTAMYSLEHDVQPDKFGSVPAAAWWALSTLTTVSYGDAVPITPRPPGFRTSPIFIFPPPDG